MMELVEMGYWWIVRRLYTVHRVGTVDFIDVRAQRNPDTSVLIRALGEAFERIEGAGEQFAALVAAHLQLVAAMGFRHGNVSPTVHAYMSKFDSEERENSHYLACRLIWAAAFIKHFNDARHGGTVPDKATIRGLAAETQLAFIRMFPDAAKWEDYLARHTS